MSAAEFKNPDPFSGVLASGVLFIPTVQNSCIKLHSKGVVRAWVANLHVSFLQLPSFLQRSQTHQKAPVERTNQKQGLSSDALFKCAHASEQRGQAARQHPSQRVVAAGSSFQHQSKDIVFSIKRRVALYLGKGGARFGSVQSSQHVDSEAGSAASSHSPTFALSAPTCTAALSYMDKLNSQHRPVLSPRNLATLIATQMASPKAKAVISKRIAVAANATRRNCADYALFLRDLLTLC
jgi:hypothetical protein